MIKRLFILLLWLFPFTVHALIGGADDAFQAGGSLRTMTAVLDQARIGGEVDGLDQSLLRATATWRPLEWMTCELHILQSLGFSTASAGAVPAGLGTALEEMRYRLIHESWEPFSGRNVSSVLGLDRANMKFTGPLADLTIGRQAVNFGKAYFWNPLDVFLPFDPRQFDREYKPGVDAIRMDVPLDAFSGLNLVGAAGREQSILGGYKGNVNTYGSALLARLYSTLWGWDVAVQGGKTYGGYQSGLGLTGEIGPMEFRSEVAFFSALASENFPMTDIPLLEDHLEAVVGTGHKFSKLLNVETEFLYNGASLPEDLASSAARWAGGYSLQIGRILGGIVINSELHPLLNAQMGWIYSFSDGSSSFQPSCVYSISDESDFTFGATINRGSRPSVNSLGQTIVGSEFGLQPDTYFGEYKFYF